MRDRLSCVSPNLLARPHSGSRQASGHDRTASVSLSQDTRVCLLVSSRLPITSQYIRATTAPRRRRTAEQLHGPLGLFQDTRILTSQRPPCLYAVPLQCNAIACASEFSWSGTARTHQRSRQTNIAICQHLISADRRQLQLLRRRWLHGKPCVTCQHTSSRPPLCGASCETEEQRRCVPTDQLSHNRRTTPAPVLTSHCNSHIVASCVFVLLVPNTITRRRRRVPSTMSKRWTASRATPRGRCQSQRMRTWRASLVSSVKTRSVKTRLTKPPSLDKEQK